MPYNFSQQLRQKLIAYFEQTQGLVISYEQADEFLDTLADFYLWIIDSER